MSHIYTPILENVTAVQKIIFYHFLESQNAHKHEQLLQFLPTYRNHSVP